MGQISTALFNVNQVKEKFFPGRSTRWIRSTFTDGELGPVFKDEGGWLISEQAIKRWQEIHVVKALSPRATRESQVTNLIQNRLEADRS